MSFQVVIALMTSALLAAAGQVCLKIGARDFKSLASLVNWITATGLSLYFLGLLLWIYGLSKAPLHVVYPFTMLTFVVVAAASVVFLGERPSPISICGWVVILIGVALAFQGGR
jgi:drug/metabolite transporter (DMT)-like permease